MRTANLPKRKLEMDEENKNNTENQTPETAENNLNDTQNNGKTVFFYVAVIACILGAVAFGLAFTKLRIYSLICSIIFELASIAFCNAQKKANNFKAVKYVKICAYVLLGIFAAFFIGGIIYVSIQP